MLAYATEVRTAVSSCCTWLSSNLCKGSITQQDTKPRLALWTQNTREKYTTSLSAQGAVLSLSFSNDGSHLAVSHGHPAPAVQVYATDNVRNHSFGPVEVRGETRAVHASDSIIHMQLHLLADASMEHAANEVQVNPLDKNMVLCKTFDSCCILRCVTHGNKSRLVEQKVNSIHGTPTCQAFHSMSFYLGTSDGLVCSFDFSGDVLHHDDGSRTLLHVIWSQFRP